MASTLLDGKTYAGNPYVQIEEGNDASAKPRRLFPLYRKQFLIGWVVAAVTGVTAFAEVATTTLRAESFAGKSATAGIQQAIDAATAKGGGTVRLAPGDYAVASIFLKDNVTLHLEKGATLIGSTNFTDYALCPSSVKGLDHAIVNARDAHNVALTGEGVVNGRGRFAVHNNNDNRRWLDCLFARCDGVKLEGVTLRDPSFWTCYFSACTNVVARRVTIKSHANFNGDGIDIDAQNVLIEDCVIDAEDDAICLKSDTPGFVVRNVEVRNCTLASNCNFIKFGTASLTGFADCRIHHCTLVRPRAKSHFNWRPSIVPGVTGPQTGIAGVALEVVDGGFMENVHVHDLVMKEGVQTPIFIRYGRRRSPKPGKKSCLQNILIERVRVEQTECLIASSITGVPGLRPRNIVLRDLDFTVRGGGTRRASSGPVPEREKSYPENRMFGTMLPAYGFYVRHADDIRFENVRLRYTGSTEERPPLVQDDTTGVVVDRCDFKQ